MGSLLIVLAVLLVGGGIGYYFKVYRPKHEAADLDEDDYDYEDEADPTGRQSPRKKRRTRNEFHEQPL